MGFFDFPDLNTIPKEWEKVVDFIKEDDEKPEDVIFNTEDPALLKDHLRNTKLIIKNSYLIL
ncbi:MAG: hypothetical protein A3B91_02075 [Candidatus Yanofskybacteria bacterium RIFCSPHIGHO2_02_FULL_41_29]|uniref:Uncharacterized protein n=1 Tax=Candidatus Yanofskybacteria bacterium RIFCSPHIGHO2_01_FULL_41_53 TaxID=1802663 RepID=A0A1F8EGP7_9BACT|nr:MAG: hypothetical protein A2650_01355 [Candidatus Yanofskybacteria bacterium RIFCSPHIGHO2_01_FULL_41_53]OGN10520.1 MAG: hypothetical protein A3B91_02075 [Candidatus Yanofskybacteria bacterium RIFCSPHIGHO2_02_FULL_41_29]OGN18916.1 MAG: hypothetical protein A3F48_02645 [Candidatus Yanofskybacteria bacterium RIFCSPHIGHO2_12_FULL_41_9]OGN21507.1 MAG: hypothetical protein A2916_01705 [Candidatus Yanofskybacteria bacterium RIFCSPLOWO2_01_FULL_41_67]OGN28481.1 MAG: hypothetical protein A3H54_04425 